MCADAQKRTWHGRALLWQLPLEADCGPRTLTELLGLSRAPVLSQLLLGLKGQREGGF